MVAMRVSLNIHTPGHTPNSKKEDCLAFSDFGVFFLRNMRLLHKSYSSYPQVNISPQNQA